jgi:hypothetical protein
MHYPSIRRVRAVSFCLIAAVAGTARGADKSTPDLAKYFGWDEPRIIVLDRNLGPAVVGDFNGDGLNDLAAVNNAKSRIEIHLQRKEARTDQEIERDYKVNELAPSRYYDRVEVSVQHRVTGLRAFDVDKDGKLDIVYAGIPAELVMLKQTGTMKFETLSKRRVKDLAASQNGIEIADVMGDTAPELLAVVGGRVAVFGLSTSEVTGEPVMLGTGGSNQEIVAFFTEDYNGDGLTDVAAAIPDDSSPVRMWLQDPTKGSASKNGQLGPELRFEMPALRELQPVRLAGQKAASLAVIERASRRIVLDELSSSAESGQKEGRAGERDASAEVYVFPGPGNKTRSTVVADIDGDGLLDLLSTDQQANTLVLYRQQQGVGLGAEERFSALKDPKIVAAGQWDGSGPLEVFVLSEADKVVGMATYSASEGRIGFPQPVSITTAGASPVAMAFAGLPSGPALAVIVRDKRDHTLEIHRPNEEKATTLKLEGVNRPPQSMLAGDFDHDGQADLVLFTPAEPLVMVRNIDGPADKMQVLTDKNMPQFGLVQAAGPDNTAMLDIDGDGKSELLVADQNFVRACAFSEGKGWRVVEQITLPESAASLVGLTVTSAGGSASIVASDKANKRLVVMSRQDGEWRATDRLRFAGFEVTSLFAGSFSGDATPEILAASESAFAVIRAQGTRHSLEEFAAYRSDDDDLLEHEIEAGDLNGDGFTDLVVLDAREQMAQIFTVSAGRRLLHATEFKVFESRIFGRGDDREFEPSAAIIADVTGDGRNDLILQVHDRYVIYPQMTGKK